MAPPYQLLLPSSPHLERFVYPTLEKLSQDGKKGPQKDSTACYPLRLICRSRMSSTSPTMQLTALFLSCLPSSPGLIQGDIRGALRDALRRLKLRDSISHTSRARRCGHTAALARDPPSEHRQVAQIPLGSGATLIKQVFFNGAMFCMACVVRRPAIMTPPMTPLYIA